MEEILKYFHSLSNIQLNQFKELSKLYDYWNAQINVISRKDIDHFYLHHVLHSLSVCKFISFSKGSKILDLGCGGGFPGIPLSIFYPDVEFVLVDSIGKKIKVVQEISFALNLKNLRAYHIRAEEHKEKFQFVLSRAVAKLPELILWSKNSFDSREMNSLPNGLIAYKGGDIKEELASLKKSNPYEIWNISDKFEEDYFNQKYLLYVQK